MLHNSNKTIAVALSGGVDSAVAAKILKNEGHELVGFFLKLWNDPKCQVKGENRCCDYEALEDARSVAKNLDIPFYVIDAREEFKAEVVDYFIDEYKHIRTPNPCVICNEKIKFDLLLKKAIAIGCDYLATGHYARIASENSKIQDTRYKQITNSKSKKSNQLMPNTYRLFTGADQTKDQSYNLYRLDQEQLSRIIFPLGEKTKAEVRELASKWDLPVKEKEESQEICFFGDSDYREFLKRYLPTEYFLPGDIVDSEGNIIGRHHGLVNYTIGQRKNINQTQKLKAKTQNVIARREATKQSLEKIPLYVVGFNIEKNQLIVGEDSETYKKEMMVGHLHWIMPKVSHPGLDLGSISVKIRSQARAVSCTIQNPKPKTQNVIANEAKQSFDNLTIVFDSPQRAVTPGQSAVFYNGDEVIGGGIIGN